MSIHNFVTKNLEPFTQTKIIKSRLITQYRNIFSHILEGQFFGKPSFFFFNALKKEGRASEILDNHDTPILCNQPC